MPRFTPEQKIKQQAALEEKKQTRQASTITVAGWTLFRLDESNWCVERGSNRSYYPHYEDAVAGLLREATEHRVSQKQRAGVESILAAIKAARADVMAAIKPKGKHTDASQ